MSRNLLASHRGHGIGRLLQLACLSMLAFRLALSMEEPEGEDEERLIGWKGDTYKPKSFVAEQRVFHICDKPRAYVYKNFVTPQEAKHVILTALPKMRRSTVVGENGSSVEDEYRTSYGTFLNRYQDPVIKSIQDRIAAWIHIPVQHQEDMQVLRYGSGQYYHQHTDSLDNDTLRMATVLVYLSTPEEGGETSFPDSTEWAHPGLKDMFGPQSACARGKVAYRPRRGDAFLFWSAKPDGRTEDPMSNHEGCPVVKGVKWTTTTWSHTEPFRPEDWDPARKTFRKYKDTEPDPGLCQDSTSECIKWAAQGECSKNQEFMMGGQFQLGACRAACNACESCEAADKECYYRNRRQAGYLVLGEADMPWVKV